MQVNIKTYNMTVKCEFHKIIRKIRLIDMSVCLFVELIIACLYSIHKKLVAYKKHKKDYIQNCLDYDDNHWFGLKCSYHIFGRDCDVIN